MSIRKEELTARNNYKYDKCGCVIPANSQYICITEHIVSQTATPKGLYHNRYYNKHHTNLVYRYHIGCEPK